MSLNHTLHAPLTIALLALFALATGAWAGPDATAPQAPAVADGDNRLDWWREARFGLFIHWGLYAIPSGQWTDSTDHGEWILETAHIPVDEYEKFVPRFNPVKFDADRWVQTAKDAGMKYIVITSKHHDGFCLFDSALTDYDIASTPYKGDIMRELSDACRRQGLEICWYHSIMDWHHPDYLPRRSWEKRSAEGADYNRFVRYVHGQVEELLTNYGRIGVMWFDGEWEHTWTHEHGVALYEHARRVQQEVIVNNRVDKGRAGMAGMTTDAKFKGDFGTPEQEIPATGFPGVDWESCMTMNRHWGYNRVDLDFKPASELIRMLVDIASKGGNFLLNIGPTAEGEFPPQCIERLQEMGRWMKTNAQAIHGTAASPFKSLPWGRCTSRTHGDTTTLYLHVFDWPRDGALRVPGLGNEVRGARLLADGSQREVRRGEGDVQVLVPATAPDPVCSVVALEIAGRPLVYDLPEITAASSILVRPLDVTIATTSAELLVRYTIDGSEPTASSRQYTQPIRIDGTSTVKARAFHSGRPVSGVAEARFTKVSAAPAASAANRTAGLRRETYQGKWDALPDFAALRPNATTKVSAIALDAGTPVEYVAHRYGGYIEIPEDDVYTFALVSDDGSRLTIDGTVVVDNDGLHGPAEKRGVAPLARGPHGIMVEWFNKTGGAELDLLWSRAGGRFEAVPAAALSHQP